MKKLIFTITLLWQSACGQSLDEVLKKNAVEIDVTDTLVNPQFCQAIDRFKLIMIGEMHGTKEPAQFVAYVVNQLIQYRKDIQIGLEIPSDMMDLYVTHPSVKNLQNTTFFSQGFSDGRANDQWFSLIKKYSGHSRVRLFYFDQNEKFKRPNADSVMFENVKKMILSHPEKITVLLCGNIHNRLVPFKSIKTMAYSLINDTTLNLSQKFCSVYHEYNEGTMKNNMGTGLQLSTIEPINSPYSKATPFNSYFCLLPKNFDVLYNAIFYTRVVTAAEILNVKK